MLVIRKQIKSSFFSFLFYLYIIPLLIKVSPFPILESWHALVYSPCIKNLSKVALSIVIFFICSSVD